MTNKLRWFAALSFLCAVVFLVGCRQSFAPEKDTELMQTQDAQEGREEKQPAAAPSAGEHAAEPAEEAPLEEGTEEPLPEAPANPVDLDYYFMGSLYGMGENPSFSSLFDAPDGLSRLKEFYGALNKNFDRVEYHPQSLEYVGTYTGDVKFSANGSVNGMGDDNNCHTQLKTLMIGKSIYGAFDNVVEIGSNFQEEDFQVEAVTDVIPVILGYDYLEIYDVGDMLALSLHTQPLTFQVIGFLQKNAVLQFNMDIPLDQHIIVPFYDIAYEPTDDVNAYYQEIYYSQKCEGFVSIASTADAEHMFQDVRALAEQYDLLFAVTPVKLNVSDTLHVQVFPSDASKYVSKHGISSDSKTAGNAL